MLILLAVSCLAWIGLLSLAFVFFFGTAISAGWILGGALLLAVTVWIVVMFREIRDAIEIPDSFASEDLKQNRPISDRSV